MAKGRDPLPGDLLLTKLGHRVQIALAVVIVNHPAAEGELSLARSASSSDFAGLIYFPLFMATIVEISKRSFRVRDWRSTARLVGRLSAVTGVVFALAKIWTPWSEAYRTILGAAWWPADVVDARVPRGSGTERRQAAPRYRTTPDLAALPGLPVPVLSLA